MEIVLNYFQALSFSIVRYFIFAGIPFLFLYVLFSGKYARLKIQERLAQNKDFIREILYSTQTSIIFVAVVIAMTRTPIAGYTQHYTDVNEYPLWWLPVSLLLALVLQDTYFYWMHRIMHHPLLYKPIHLLHHKSINPSPWTSYSFHLLEAFTEILIVPIVLFTIPMHTSMLIAFGTLSFAINVYGHLGYEVMPKWFRQTWLFEVLNTSVYHNLHHSKFKGNYSLYFRVWDRLMKTEHPDYVSKYDEIQERRFGR